MDIGGNGIDHQAQIALALLQSLFRPFAVLDVRGKCIPVENSSPDVAHRNHADVKPAVYAIEPTEAMLDITWLVFHFVDSSAELSRYCTNGRLKISGVPSGERRARKPGMLSKSERASSSLVRRASSARLRSSMSVRRRYQAVIWFSASRTGRPRTWNHR